MRIATTPRLVLVEVEEVVAAAVVVVETACAWVNNALVTESLVAGAVVLVERLSAVLAMLAPEGVVLPFSILVLVVAEEAEEEEGGQSTTVSAILAARTSQHRSTLVACRLRAIHRYLVAQDS